MSTVTPPVGASTAIVTVPLGPPALGALGGVIRAARGGDDLAPVTVVVASRHAGVSVRRHLARLVTADGRAGLVNIAWRTLAEVAEEVVEGHGGGQGAAAKPRLAGVLRRAAVRGALADVPTRFAAGAGNAATEQRLEQTLRQLRELSPGQLAALAARGGAAAESVAVFHAWRRRLAAFADERDLLDEATALIAAGAAVDGVGPVVAYLPERLSPAELRLLSALARAGRLTVVLGTTGDEQADTPIDELRNRLVAEIGAGAVEVSPRPPGPVPVEAEHFVRAPDEDEEVRIAVRRILAALAGGTAPEDVAIVYRVERPYALLVHEHLETAGIAHHGASPVTLAQSVAARTLLGFLRVAERGFPRSELFRWLRGSAVRLADGRAVPTHFDALARRAGVARGVDQWHARLARLRAELAEAEASGDGPPGFRVADVDELTAFVDHLVALARPPVAARWSAVVDWAGGVLDTLLAGAAGNGAALEEWPPVELDRLAEVRALLEELRSLDRVDPTVTPARFARVLAHELERRRASVGTFGHGVFVGRVADLVGARHELVVVLGMVEGKFPPRAGAEVVLPERDRSAVGGPLLDLLPGPGDEARSVLAALGAAPHRHLSFARVDTAAQREATPAPAFLRELGRRRGARVGFDALDHLDDPAFHDVPSFVAGVTSAGPQLCRQERRMRALLGGQEHFADLDRGLAAARDRRQRRFSPWTGDVGALEGLRFTGERVGSATGFEDWATCPFRYFLRSVLRVRPYDRSVEVEAIAGRDRGSLVHEVLERFVAECLDRTPGFPWTEADHERMRDQVREIARRFEEEGRTGRPLLWEAEVDRLLRRLERILADDAAARSHGSVHPAAVELRFGFAGEAPVEIALPSGRRLAFRGAIDRIDRDPATGRLVVLDYKTGGDDGYRGLGEDITCGGRHLQLVIYGEAARARFGGDEVEAYYWFVESPKKVTRLGGAIGPAERHRLGEVLDVVVDGIEGGRFPANPGALDYFGWNHCGYCDFDRVCSSSRDDLWEGVRWSPRLGRYRQLAEPDLAEPDGSDAKGTP